MPPLLPEVINRTSIVVLAIIMPISAAFAQSQTGALVGLIHDREHNLIPGVEFRLSRADASQPVSHTVSDRAGRVEFVGLPAGVYSLDLTLPGWQGQHFSKLNVEAARTLDVYILLIPALRTISNKTGRFICLTETFWWGGGLNQRPW